MRQKGFVHIIILGIVLAVAVSSFYFARPYINKFFWNAKEDQTGYPTPVAFYFGENNNDDQPQRTRIPISTPLKENQIFINSSGEYRVEVPAGWVYRQNNDDSVYFYFKTVSTESTDASDPFIFINKNSFADKDDLVNINIDSKEDFDYWYESSNPDYKYKFEDEYGYLDTNIIREVNTWVENNRAIRYRVNFLADYGGYNSLGTWFRKDDFNYYIVMNYYKDEELLQHREDYLKFVSSFKFIN